MLNSDEQIRYDRQIMLKGIGEAGQEKLKKARIVIAGSGGLGSPIAIYLASAGIGTIRIIDHDIVELSNLNRQVLHWDSDIGRHKVESAAEKLRQLNPGVTIETSSETISEDSVSRLISGCDLVMDGLDNLPTRYLVNKAAINSNTPFIHGAVYGFEGRILTVIPGESACLRCVYRGPVPATKFPVIGVTPVVIGCLQATEAIKYLLGLGKLLTDRLLVYDGLKMRFTELTVRRDPDCVDCAQPR